MNSGRPRGLAAMLTLALGAGTVAGAGLLGSPAWADDVLSGTYTLDSASIWTGQSVTLTQTELTDPTPESTPERTVDWGDGVVEPLDADKATHTYATPNTYTVKVSLKEGEVEGTVTNPAKPVQVANVTGTFKFSVASNWTWKGGGATAKLLLSAVPANTTRVWVDWGDGKTSLLARTHTSTTHYYPVGSYTAKVTLENSQGKVPAKSAGSYAAKVDTWVPATSTLKVPSKPKKASSWKTIQGTAKDNQIGMDSVGVQVFKWTSTKDYYYNFVTKKWVKYTWGKTKIPNAAVSWRPVDSKGVWKVGVAGLSKGYTIEVDWAAVDRAGNVNGWKYRVQKLTS
jgi:hypothetical protein